jgi:hypothetical protein
MSKLTADEDKLLMRGFDYATDSNGYDSSYDDEDVLRVLAEYPNLTAVPISLKTNIPVHRVIAAMARLKTAKKVELEKFEALSKTKELEVNYLKLVNNPCSTGNDATVEEAVPTEEPLTVITLWQPWATFIIKGIKTYETRSWETNYRGKILIHAAKRPINWCELQLNLLEEIYPDITEWDYPLGAIVGEATLETCRTASYARMFIDKTEKLCGNFDDGRFAWLMKNPKPLFIPNVKGKQGLWKYEPLTTSDDVVLGETLQSDEPKTKPDIPHSQNRENILLTEPPRLIDANGQLSIFFDDSEEPPDPDDFKSLEEYHKQREIWAKSYPELAQAMAERIALIEKSKSTQFNKGDRVQQINNSKWVGEIKSISKKGVTVRYCCGFEFTHTNPEECLKLFSVDNSFFKLGDLAIQPGFEDKIFLVKTIYESGMIGVLDEDDQHHSFPTNWLNLFKSVGEQIKPSNKSIPLEQPKRKRPQKGCGSGYLKVRKANVKRNQAKGRSPDIYYVYYYSYSNQYGKEIKSSISVPRAKIAQVKQMIANREHYVKIAKFLGKSLPLSY